MVPMHGRNHGIICLFRMALSDAEQGFIKEGWAVICPDEAALEKTGVALFIA